LPGYTYCFSSPTTAQQDQTKTGIREAESALTSGISTVTEFRSKFIAKTTPFALEGISDDGLN
jgi:hypothetical protein